MPATEQPEKEGRTHQRGNITDTQVHDYHDTKINGMYV
jgi:hypothetical protein